MGCSAGNSSGYSAIRALLSKVDSHSNVVPTKAKSFIKWSCCLATVQNHLITPGRTCLLNQMSNQGRANPLLLKVPVNGHVLNVTGTASSVNKLLLDYQGRCADDPVLNARDEAFNPLANPFAEDLPSLVQSL